MSEHGSKAKHLRKTEGTEINIKVIGKVRRSD